MRITVCVLALLAAGCSSVAQDFCDRRDECNQLQGESVEECVENTERGLDNLNSGARADCEAAAEECLEREACGNFGECVVVGFFTECL
ncbi:MAG: hypothetical protein AAGN82_31565 [Myxococcota bacterium]